MACIASGTQRAESWSVRRTARLLMTPAAVPIRCSSLNLSQPNHKLVTQGRRSWLTLAPGLRDRTCSPRGEISFLYFCPRSFSYGVKRVPLRTLYRVRTHAACRMVQGNIAVSGVKSNGGILDLMTARYVRASQRTVEIAFSAAPEL